VGLSAEEAARRGQPVDLYRADFAHLDRAILEGEAEGYAQVVVRKGTDLLLGAMVVGPGAGDLISEAALAMQHGLGLAQLAATVHPYPTRAEIWRKVADAWSRTRLTPMTRRVLGAWLELGR
jgi:pyruvate/2-oxoglutarate dehydrogenase complex dihydrolipoamide dehydrogenase (E3) component